MNADPRIAALPDIHGHAKGEHKPFAEERPIPYTARMLFLWFYHACRRASPRFLMVADHVNYLTFEDPAAVNLVRRALKLAQAGDLYGAAETAGVELGHAAAVSEGLRKGMRYSIGAEVDNDPRSRPDAQNIVDAMRPDGMIRSIHFLPIAHPQHGENWMWPFDNGEFTEFYETVGTEQVWELYVTALLEAIDKLPGHIVGHFYVPAKFGHWPSDAKLEEYEDRLIDACAERGFAIEINSRYFYKYYAPDDAQIERYRAAYLRLLGKAKAKGVMVAVGSDAHSPRDQGGAFDVVLALLDEAGINEIAFPINGRLARVALRATEEILRRQSGPVVHEAPVERVAVSDDDFSPVPDDEAEHEPAAAAPASPGTNGTAPAARVRPKAKPKPAIDAVADLGEPIVETAPVADESVAAPIAPVPARKRPPKKAVAKIMPEADVAPAAVEPSEQDAVADAPEEAEHQPVLEAVVAAAPEIVAAAAQSIATTVTETAQRAGSAIVEAALSLVRPKTATKKAEREHASEPPVKVGEPPATAASQTALPGAKKAAPRKAAEKHVEKAAPKSVHPTAPAKKATSQKVGALKNAAPVKAKAKAKTAKKPVAKKPVAKKATPAARPAAKKATARGAARPAAKSAKKATPARRDGSSKAPKRPVLAKRNAPKKVAAKKSAKKKSSPSRR